MSFPADSGGGGGSVARTPWYAYDMPAIWTVVSGYDTSALWQQPTGWRKTAELTNIHLSNLQQYRNQLAEAWPPERSPASQAYLAELDKLIESVRETNDNANVNHQATVTIAGATSDAKRQLQPLYDEYLANQAALTEYRAQVDAYNADTTGLPQPSPGPSPVPVGRQEELTNEARRIMTSIGGEIALAAASLRPPAPYRPPQPPAYEGESGGGGGGGSGGGGGLPGPVLIPPTVPPVSSPAPAPSGGGPRPAAPVPPAAPAPTGPGPVLGGAPPLAPPLAPAPSGPLPPIGGPVPVSPLPPGPIAPPIIGPGPTPVGRPPLTGPTVPGPTVIGGPTPPVTPAGRPPLGPVPGPGTPGPRPMPPGGLINAPPGAGLVQPARNATAAPRVNPPGGLIGQPVGGTSAGAGGRAPGGTGSARAAGGYVGAPIGQPGGAARGAGGYATGQPGAATRAAGGPAGQQPAAGTRAAGSRAAGAAAAGGGLYPAQGRAGTRRDDDETGRHWDPDNPWETEEGVAPVVLPPAEPRRHDPGPAIGHSR